MEKLFFVDAALYWHRDKKYYSSSWRGKYKSDGGVLFNQSIHLLDVLIYFFGKVKNFNVLAGFSKKNQAEDLISINFNHKNKIISNLKLRLELTGTIGCPLIYYVREDDY